MTYNKNQSLVKTQILGVAIANETRENILEYIVNFILKTGKNCFIVTPNPEILVLSHQNFSLKAALNAAEVALCDGIGLLWASRILGRPIKERFTGVDAVEMLCQKVQDWPITVGFLGGRKGVAEKSSECLLRMFPKLKISFIGEEWPADKPRKSVDILFVAYGAPKQELWMAEHINKVPVRVMVGVGGALDYIAGRVPRAPKFIRKFGFEWLFRLVIQPWRFARQTRLLVFVWLVLKEKFTLS